MFFLLCPLVLMLKSCLHLISGKKILIPGESRIQMAGSTGSTTKCAVWPRKVAILAFGTKPRRDKIVTWHCFSFWASQVLVFFVNCFSTLLPILLLNFVASIHLRWKHVFQTEKNWLNPRIWYSTWMASQRNPTICSGCVSNLEQKCFCAKSLPSGESKPQSSTTVLAAVLRNSSLCWTSSHVFPSSQERAARQNG